MKILFRVTTVMLLLCWIMAFRLPVWGTASAHPAEGVSVSEWQLIWEDGTATVSEIASGIPVLAEAWEKWGPEKLLPVKPEGEANKGTLWIKIRIPDLKTGSPALFIGKFYAQSLEIYAGQDRIFEARRYSTYDTFKLLLPLGREDGGKELFIRAQAPESRIGLPEPPVFGDYHSLLPGFLKRNIDDVVLGGAFILIAFVMLIGTFLLKRAQRASWVTLGFIIMATGIMVLTYSPILYFFYGGWISLLFDMALYTLMPALCYFVETLFGPGKFSLLRKFRYLMTGLSAAVLIGVAINWLSDLQYNKATYFFSVTLYGIFIMAALVILVAHTVYAAVKGNREAVIFTAGFAFMALTLTGELMWFYMRNHTYDLWLWKWGIFGFVVVLIVLLLRRLAMDHEMLLRYAKELELHGRQIQRSEKMQIISELAASVAHEVRNPLQVTRGFLQMLHKKANEPRDRRYFDLAIEELDRASVIITDFLTFAKPQMDEVAVLNLSKELEQIHGIMSPLAGLSEIEIRMEIPGDLCIKGNSSKLKQALINMIKNSIEAVPRQGHIRIWAYAQHSEAVIHIRDNGAGMEEEVLAKLGEPYFSTKTKGTGLGMMVTFRIVEMMEGTIRYSSRKGEGTEAVIRFPLAAIGVS